MKAADDALILRAREDAYIAASVEKQTDELVKLKFSERPIASTNEEIPIEEIFTDPESAGRVREEINIQASIARQIAERHKDDDRAIENLGEEM